VNATPREGWFRAFSCRVAAAVGTHAAFLIALAVVLVWAISGPMFGFSDR
jgi:low affinity Fe/Cu permease